MIAAASEFLFATQNRDGGWGSEEGRSSNTEATSFALIALGTQASAPASSSVTRGLRWLSGHQRHDGSWPLSDLVDGGSWATALAVLALLETDRQGALRGAAWLLRQEPRTPGWIASLLHQRAPGLTSVRLNPNLKGWAWTSGTSSFVEPTAYALLALKKARPYAHDARLPGRVREAELMLYDRMCTGGGWNYGNSIVFEADLWPFADVTALTLIALQDHQAAEANQRSLRALRGMAERVDSGLALAWVTLCLSLYGDDLTAWRRRLAKRHAETGFLGQTKSVALALLATSDRPHPLRI